MERTPLYKERGGGWFGGLLMVQATWPFASLTIYEDSLVLKVAWHTAELKMSEIVAIKRMFFFPLLADGIEIIHKNDNLPGALVFWSFGHGRQIKDLIESKRSTLLAVDSSPIPATDTVLGPTDSNSH